MEACPFDHSVAGWQVIHEFNKYIDDAVQPANNETFCPCIQVLW